VSGTAVCDEFVDLAAAAAMDALDADEARRVEEHAAQCPKCATALHEFREVAAALGSAVPQVEPPVALRGQLLDAARRERPAPAPRRRWLGQLSWPRISPAWVALAASIGLSVVSMARIAVLQGQVNDLRALADAEAERAARYDHVGEVLASDRLAIKPLQPVAVAQTVGSRGMVYLDPSSGTGMIMCRNLPPLEPGHAWQVWFVRGSERVSGGMLWPDGYGNGYTLISVPQDLQSFDSIGLTDEPGNGGKGSAWPTTPRVLGTTLQGTSQ
jgi:hypothetical protein